MVLLKRSAVNNGQSNFFSAGLTSFPEGTDENASLLQFGDGFHGRFGAEVVVVYGIFLRTASMRISRPPDRLRDPKGVLMSSWIFPPSCGPPRSAALRGP